LEEIRAFKEKDFSDSPVLTDEQLSNMKPCHLVNKDTWKPRKQVLSIRIDADVLAAIKASGKGYQTRVNDILRDAVSSDRL
jgi:uncharacterized protein (DUF4415 family)